MTDKNQFNQFNDKRTEIVLWSIALPGFGQFLNRQYFKGAVLLILEFLVNIKSNLNLGIISSFRGDIAAAIAATDFQWLMFYPCIYMYAIWDAYKDAGGNSVSFAFLPFVFAAYLGTIGVTYSASFSFMGNMLGPIWLPIILMLVGIGLGLPFTFFLSRKP